MGWRAGALLVGQLFLAARVGSSSRRAGTGCGGSVRSSIVVCIVEIIIVLGSSIREQRSNDQQINDNGNDTEDYERGTKILEGW